MVITMKSYETLFGNAGIVRGKTIKRALKKKRKIKNSGREKVSNTTL
jgi:hypothetical protein